MISIHFITFFYIVEDNNNNKLLFSPFLLPFFVSFSVLSVLPYVFMRFFFNIIFLLINNNNNNNGTLIFLNSKFEKLSYFCHSWKLLQVIKVGCVANEQIFVFDLLARIPCSWIGNHPSVWCLRMTLEA